MVLAACDTAEERAEKHLASALELIEQGDIPRARVELLNVFKLNPTHREARVTIAQLQRDAGKTREAFGHYLRLVEQYPSDLEGLYALADMAIELDNWEAAEPYIKKVGDLAPDDIRSKIVLTALDYRTSILQNDAEMRREAARTAMDLRPEAPDNTTLRAIIVDSMVLDGENVPALKELEELQALAPDDRRFYTMRLGIMTRLDDRDGIERTLKEMVTRFPDDVSIAQTLISFYTSQDDLDGAEAFLRTRFQSGEVDNDARVSLIRFLAETRDLPTAIEQADRFIEEGTNDQLFRSLRATLLFDNGDRDSAISELEDIIAKSEPSDETREIKVSLAQILSRTGNEVGGRSLVEEVLEEDASNVNGLRLKALWLINDDETDEAIGLLRRALDQDPTNAFVLTTMAEAHLRNGERELAGEMLSRAVTASNRGHKESLDYARFLIGEKRYAAAESVVLDGLRLHRNSLELYAELTKIFIAVEDWPRLEQLERALREFNTPDATNLADRVRVSVLRAQKRDADAVDFLADLAARDDGNRSAEIAIVRAHLENGNPTAALNYLRELRNDAPDDTGLKFLTAAVSASVGELETAETIYRELIAAGGASQRTYLELTRVLSAKGEKDAAEALVEEALIEFPDGGDLLWMKASFAEQRQDFDGAIEIYEALYERNTATSVIANNLASLLSTHRTDEESLERAWRIARRLRDSEFGPYQDTFGWIAYRKGQYSLALEHLEPAAATLVDDALTQYHLGMTYLALENWEMAKTTLERALQLAGDDPRAQFDDARSGLNTAVSTLEALGNRDTDAPNATE